MRLSVLIPTIQGREKEFTKLYNFLIEQLNVNNLGGDVEILHLSDNKEISIGLKRDKLYKMAKGLFSVMIDDDDTVSSEFLVEIISAINKGDCDCIGYFEHCTINGQVQKSLISLTVNQWQSHDIPINGFHHRRTPFFKVPIKTEICQKVGVKDMRYAEDHDFAIRIYPLLKKENFIYRDMYYYTANSLTIEQHKNRYGITK